ncbi:hypothetical protein G4B88_007760 [Cannabis sativa]|uniref:Alpha/beta hydrolase n=1 Tax=Cannabis sativa TaxID=3483 RepID=A0A7J6HET6_CANSA|nr:hypothetical protein G4B88_007760 [Cannabis sativa]
MELLFFDKVFFSPVNFWTWKGCKIHYVVQGEGSPVVLIHGFGASAYHWRFSTYEKAIIEYDAMVWKDQVVDFLQEIVKEPAVLVGNR